MNLTPRRTISPATDALFKSGIQTFDTGIKIKDPELLKLSGRQLELAAKGGSVVAEYFRQIVLLRLPNEKNEINISEIAEALYELLHDPDLEHLFPQILKSFIETLESAQDKNLIRLCTIVKSHYGTMDEIIQLLISIAKKKPMDTNIALSKLYLSIRLFLSSLPDHDRTSK